MVAAFRSWTGVARQSRSSEWMFGHTPLHLQGGNGGPVSSLGEEVGKDSTAGGGQGDKQEWWEVKALRQRPANSRKFEFGLFYRFYFYFTDFNFYFTHFILILQILFYWFYFYFTLQILFSILQIYFLVYRFLFYILQVLF